MDKIMAIHHSWIKESSVNPHLLIDIISFGGGVFTMAFLQGTVQTVFFIVSSVAILVNSIINIKKRILAYKLDKAKNDEAIKRIKQKK